MAQRAAYTSFPPELQKILDERLAEARQSRAPCFAGRIRLSDMHPDACNERTTKADLVMGPYHPSLQVFRGGWFIQRQCRKDYMFGWGRIVARAFGYPPGSAQVRANLGEITYSTITLLRTQEHERSRIEGIVLDEDDRPFEGARIDLRFPYARMQPVSGPRGYMPERTTCSDAHGAFQFDKLGRGPYIIMARTEGRATFQQEITIEPGAVLEPVLYLVPESRLEIDFVYQPNGTRWFKDEDAISGTVTWHDEKLGLDFSDGKVETYERGSRSDLKLVWHDDTLCLGFEFGPRGRTEFYDAGPRVFERVSEASRWGYSHKPIPVMQGHVYVIKTYEGNYAKFIIRDLN